MDAARVTGAIVAVAASLALLSGCVEGREAPAGGVSDEELARYQDYVGAQMWERTGLSEAMRPEVEPVYIQIEDWSDALNACESIRERAVATNASPTAVVVSEYSCRMRYQLSGAQLGLLNEAQLDYLYDYYMQVTVPCLEANGMAVAAIPSREDFLVPSTQLKQVWTPYYSVDSNRDVRFLMSDRCRYVPEGFSPF